MLRTCRKNYVNWNILASYRYAHRGLHDLAAGIPENTLPAFHAAVAHGFGAELDVHLTRDGRLMVLHDSDLRRLCGLDCQVCAMDSSTLSQLPILGTDLHPPFLEEVLPLFEEKTPLIVELKPENGNAAALAEQTCQMLERYHLTYCMESFDPRALFWLRRHRKDICRGQLACDFFSPDNENSLPPLLRFMMTRLMGNILSRPDFIAYKWEDRAQPAVALCRRRYGAREVSWTLRSPQELEAAEAAGCIPIFEGFVPAAHPEKG